VRGWRWRGCGRRLGAVEISIAPVISGGLSAPWSDLSDNVNPGYSLNLGVDVRPPGVPVGVRFEAGLNRFGRKTNSPGSPGTVRAISATTNAVVNLGSPSAPAYLIGGVGAYDVVQSFTDPAGYFVPVGGGIITSTSSLSLWKPGFNFGGGLHFPVGRMSAIVEVRYHAVLGDTINGTDVRLIPITFGVQF
jgi:hypothetical protein